MNAYQLQSAVPKHQEWTRFSSFLDDLVKLGRIERINMDGVRKGAVIYKITDLGRETVNKIRELQNNPLMQAFDFFRKTGKLYEN